MQCGKNHIINWFLFRLPAACEERGTGLARRNRPQMADWNIAEKILAKVSRCPCLLCGHFSEYYFSEIRRLRIGGGGGGVGNGFLLRRRSIDSSTKYLTSLAIWGLLNFIRVISYTKICTFILYIRLFSGFRTQFSSCLCRVSSLGRFSRIGLDWCQKSAYLRSKWLFKVDRINSYFWEKSPFICG